MSFARDNDFVKIFEPDGANQGVPFGVMCNNLAIAFPAYPARQTFEQSLVFYKMSVGTYPGIDALQASSKDPGVPCRLVRFVSHAHDNRELKYHAKILALRESGLMPVEDLPNSVPLYTAENEGTQYTFYVYIALLDDSKDRRGITVLRKRHYNLREVGLEDFTVVIPATFIDFSVCTDHSVSWQEFKDTTHTEPGRQALVRKLKDDHIRRCLNRPQAASAEDRYNWMTKLANAVGARALFDENERAKWPKDAMEKLHPFWSRLQISNREFGYPYPIDEVRRENIFSPNGVKLYDSFKKGAVDPYAVKSLRDQVRIMRNTTHELNCYTGWYFGFEQFTAQECLYMLLSPPCLVGNPSFRPIVSEECHIITMRFCGTISYDQSQRASIAMDTCMLPFRKDNPNHLLARTGGVKEDVKAMKAAAKSSSAKKTSKKSQNPYAYGSDGLGGGATLSSTASIDPSVLSSGMFAALASEGPAMGGYMRNLAYTATCGGPTRLVLQMPQRGVASDVPDLLRLCLIRAAATPMGIATKDSATMLGILPLYMDDVKLRKPTVVVSHGEEWCRIWCRITRIPYARFISWLPLYKDNPTIVDHFERLVSESPWRPSAEMAKLTVDGREIMAQQKQFLEAQREGKVGAAPGSVASSSGSGGGAPVPPGPSAGSGMHAQAHHQQPQYDGAQGVDEHGD